MGRRPPPRLSGSGAPRSAVGRPPEASRPSPARPLARLCHRGRAPPCAGSRDPGPLRNAASPRCPSRPQRSAFRAGARPFPGDALREASSQRTGTAGRRDPRGGQPTPARTGLDEGRVSFWADIHFPATSAFWRCSAGRGYTARRSEDRECVKWSHFNQAAEIINMFKRHEERLRSCSN